MSLLYHNQQPLFNEFQSANLQDWIHQSEVELSGKECEELWLGKEIDRIHMYPFYTEAKKQGNNLSFFDFMAKAYMSPVWKYQETIWLDETHNFDEINALCKSLLRQGADGIFFDCTLQSEAPDISLLTEGIINDKVSLSWKFNKDTNLDKLNFPKNMQGAIYLGNLMNSQQIKASTSIPFDSINVLFQQSLPGVKKLGIDASVFTNCGISLPKEIGLCCSFIVAYLDQLTEEGVDAVECFENLELSIGTRSAYLLDIAKFRALQILLHQLADAYQVSYPHKFSIRAVTSQVNKSSYDANTNLLRNTAEAMAAIIGGCSAISILPANNASTLDNPFYRRLSRNISHILKHEAHLDWVLNPADGSYALENLTNQICEKSWDYFLELESHGGFFEAMKLGVIQQDIAQDVQTFAEQTRLQQKIYVGANRYASDQQKFMGNNTLVKSDDQPPEIFSPINFPLLVEKYRLKVDEWVTKGKPRPKVLMVAVSEDVSASQFNLRKSYVEDIFNIFGISSEKSSISLFDHQFSKQNTKDFDALVLLGDDKVYSAMDEQNLKTRLSRLNVPVYLAGKPERILEKTEAFGLQECIYQGMDLIDFVLDFFKAINFNPDEA